MIKAPTPLSTFKTFLVDYLSSKLKSLARVLTESDCLLCHGATSEASRICRGCTLDLPWNLNACRRCAEPLGSHTGNTHTCGACMALEPAFDRCLTAFTFAFPIRHAIHQFKYSQQRYWAKPLSCCLYTVIEQDTKPDQHPDVLMPVPMDSEKKRQRGIHHSEVLARQLAQLLSLPVDNKTLQKIRSTSSQSRLSKGERQRNLRGSFRVRTKPPYRHVAIVDDVITTGATAETLAILLKQHGVEDVSIWCIARTPPPGFT